MIFLQIVINIALISVAIKACNGHGLMSYPIPRGGTSGRSSFISTVLNRSHTTDFKLHFPAGDKTGIAGAAVRSQMRNAGSKGWTMYEPFNPSFRWRYGVCGDLPFGNEHLKGGIFYNEGKIVETFPAGSVLSIEMTIVANHNGYIELYLCDVQKCSNGDISPGCFLQKPNPCMQLLRAPNAKCDNKRSMACGPIDEKNPGRWYLPCPIKKKNSKFYTYGKDKSIQYQLPKSLSCHHCVLQFSWVSANFCNPPGYVNYFSGRNKPHWGTCRGEGNARGQVNKKLPQCGGKHFSEEYLLCSDIKIV